VKVGARGGIKLAFLEAVLAHRQNQGSIERFYERNPGFSKYLLSLNPIKRIGAVMEVKSAYAILSHGGIYVAQIFFRSLNLGGRTRRHGFSSKHFHEILISPWRRV